MPSLAQATPHVKKNILLIRFLLSLTLLCFAFLFTQNDPKQAIVSYVYSAVLFVSFIPLFIMANEKFNMVRTQYLIFAMDFVFLLGGLYCFTHFDTNLLIIIFLTFFISALSQSVGRSIFVGCIVIGLYTYLVYYESPVFNYLDPMLLLSCALLFVVAVHSGYLAYRTVQEEKEIMELNKKAAWLSEKLKESDQAALNYAATLKDVLDTLPIGAIAVSTEGNVIFANARAGKLLDVNPKVLANQYLFSKTTSLGALGEKMAQALKSRQDLKKEYVTVTLKDVERYYRLDSASGSSPSGKQWGTLFLLQEASTILSASTNPAN